CGRLQAQYYILIIGPQTGRGAYPEAVFKVLQAHVNGANISSNACYLRCSDEGQTLCALKTASIIGRDCLKWRAYSKLQAPKS
ncbi:MAG: hypothetical protein RBR82_13260, partial [Pseudomonas sp.]|nr:hypothetical protein [Pseudomonas sp.]